MSALQELTGATARMVAETSRVVTYQAWRIGARNEGLPLNIQADTNREAVEAVLPFCAHKDVFAVLEHNTVHDRKTVRFYAVKRKTTPRYAYVDHVMRAVHDHYADEMFALKVGAFAPVEPWSWAPGSDVVGIDRGLIDAIPARKDPTNDQH